MERRNFLKNTFTGAAILGASSLVPGCISKVLDQKTPNKKNMIKLGASVMLFKPMDIEIVAPYIKAAGYTGTTISLNNLVEDFNTAKWKEEVKRLKTIAADNDLELMSAGTGSRDLVKTKYLFETAAELGVSIICCGPGGVPGDEASYQKSIDELGAMAKIAEEYKIPLVCKAHDGHYINTTSGLLRMINDIKNPYFGADIDPYHVFLAHESLTEAAKSLVPYLKYAHIQDFKFDSEGKFKRTNPIDRACGRGEVDIPGYLKVLIDGGYEGPLMVELYGNEMDLNTAISVTAQGHGYLNACLKILG
jgi:sugar phosphate isomerase/epimerase